MLQLRWTQGLTISIKESRFNLRPVNFTGKVFSTEGISPNPSKVATLQAAGPPELQAEVH